MNWFTLETILLPLDHIYVTVGKSCYKFIEPWGGTVEAATFRLDTNSGNVSGYPFKTWLNLDVNISLSDEGFIFRR